MNLDLTLSKFCEQGQFPPKGFSVRWNSKYYGSFFKTRDFKSAEKRCLESNSTLATFERKKDTNVLKNIASKKIDLEFQIQFKCNSDKGNNRLMVTVSWKRIF